jgi:hypothetical protein
VGGERAAMGYSVYVWETVVSPPLFATKREGDREISGHRGQQGFWFPANDLHFP